MSDLPLPAGQAMSTMWMPMPGQTWAGAAAAFIGMWITMTVAMMLPSLAPALWRFYRSIPAHRGALTAFAGVGYLGVWAVIGTAAFPLGASLSAIAMKQMVLAQVAPIAAGVVVLVAGAWQLTAWKARHLACCRRVPACEHAAPSGAAWRYGVRLGLHCARCCGNLMLVPLVIGLMDTRAMMAVGAAITLERVAPSGARVARAIGVVLIGGGVCLIVRAAALG